MDTAWVWVLSLLIAFLYGIGISFRGTVPQGLLMLAAWALMASPVAVWWLQGWERGLLNLLVVMVLVNIGARVARHPDKMAELQRMKGL